jgi:pimeloyl-ACP methyl ester carboxylesterase
LEDFSLAASAHDLAALMQATHQQGVAVIAWGQSAGTRIVDLLMRMYPEVLDAAILESPVPTDYSLQSEDSAADAALNRLLALCASDDQCAAQLDDPRGALRRAFDVIDSGSCPELELDRAGFERLLDQLLLSNPLNTTIPALLRRVADCDTDELDFSRTLLQITDPTSTEISKSYSSATFQLISASELWNGPNADQTTQFFHRAQSNSPLGMALESWPRYTPDNYDASPPSTIPIPTLSVTGGLDSRIAPEAARSFAEHAANANFTHLELPWSSHLPLVNAGDDAASSCADLIVSSFILQPAVALDVSCISQSGVLDFTGRDWAPSLFDRSSYWSRKGDAR